MKSRSNPQTFSRISKARTPLIFDPNREEKEDINSIWPHPLGKLLW